VSRYTVVYDACVLFPAPLRDLLVQLATANLFRAKWTEDIHREWIGAVLEHRNDLTAEQLNRTRALMDRAVMDCIVTGYERLIDALILPDKDDRHVLAAAIHCRADAIVSFNLRDFPNAALAPHNIEAIHPDDFLTYQFDLDEAAVVRAAAKCCHRLKSPAKTGREYLDTLLLQSLPKTVAALRPYETIISSVEPS
jgi:predicted nucleic acid-binding protein